MIFSNTWKEIVRIYNGIDEVADTNVYKVYKVLTRSLFALQIFRYSLSLITGGLYLNNIQTFTIYVISLGLIVILMCATFFLTKFKRPSLKFLMLNCVSFGITASLLMCMPKITEYDKGFMGKRDENF